MNPVPLSLDERQEALVRFLRKYKKRGFRVVSQGPTTAELYRPARFPAWLFPEQTLYLDIDPTGWIYVRKV